MRKIVLLAMFVLAAGMAAADTGEMVPAPSWQYGFPPALWVTISGPSRGDMRYLAATTTRWRYHPAGKPEEVTVEGENAVYFFDLMRKRLLWKEALPEGSPAWIEGVSAHGEFVAVRIGRSDSERVSGYRGGRSVEGVVDSGTREPGVRLYDRKGRLFARNVPLEHVSGALVLRPPEDGERPLSGELTKALATAGIQSVPVLGRKQGFARADQDGPPMLAYFDLDGTARWEYELPPLGPRLSGGWATGGESADDEYALFAVNPADVPDPLRTQRVLLFGRAEGLIWTKDLSMHLEGEIVPTPYSIRLLLASGAASVVVQRGPVPSVVQVFDRQGREKSALGFGGIIPVGLSVSPNGRYWAAALRRWTQEPGLDDKGWTEGIHVFDCDTGKVVWRSPAMGKAVSIAVTDSGGVVAFSDEERVVAVFTRGQGPGARGRGPVTAGTAAPCGESGRLKPAPPGTALRVETPRLFGRPGVLSAASEVGKHVPDSAEWWRREYVATGPGHHGVEPVRGRQCIESDPTAGSHAPAGAAHSGGGKPTDGGDGEPGRLAEAR